MDIVVGKGEEPLRKGLVRGWEVGGGGGGDGDGGVGGGGDGGGHGTKYGQLVKLALLHQRQNVLHDQVGGGEGIYFQG